MELEAHEVAVAGYTTCEKLISFNAAMLITYAWVSEGLKAVNRKFADFTAAIWTTFVDMKVEFE